MIGPLKIEMPDNSVMDFTNVTSVPSIPTLMCVTRKPSVLKKGTKKNIVSKSFSFIMESYILLGIMTNAKILIILEKEAMFQRLIREFPNLTKEIIFLTVSFEITNFLIEL